VEDLEREIECSGPTPSQFKPWLRKFLETRMEGDPRECEVLADALDHEWIAYNCQSYDNGVGGAGEAAVALRRMGIRARPALARLRAAVMSERDDWSSSTDRWLAFEAYVAIGGDDAEIGNLLDQLAARGTVREQFVEGVARLAQGNNSLLPHLSRLQQTIRKNKGECTP
jgi:hypothetical protein